MTRRLFLKKSSSLIGMMFLSRCSFSLSTEVYPVHRNEFDSSAGVYGHSLYKKLDNPSETHYSFDPTRSYFRKTHELKTRSWALVDGHVELTFSDWS